MSFAIAIANLSKRYRLGSWQSNSYSTLRESIMEAVGATYRRLKSTERPASRQDMLWALQDVSLTIQPGEAVGIVGRNGAGKSTLLKVISRITEPTEGTVMIQGRVGSLLEVGTGFHPELTGRENVFLNGAIIGMSRKETARKFDEIVEFAEIGRFIDTPVKRYSSGMYVRLAFAVSAHLEPDIFLIDEVLSVGDLAFQRKCMDHAKRLRERNTTLVVVSHNMFAVKSMCNRAILMSEGQVEFDGTTEEVTRLYDQQGRLDVASWAQDIVGSDPTKRPIFLRGIEILDEEGRARTLFDHGERMRVRITFEAQERVRDPNFTVAFVRSDNVGCCNFNTAMDDFSTGTVIGSGVVEVLTPPISLVSELYSLQVLIWDSKFQRLYCAQMGKNFHVRHPILSTAFGVFHERAEWAWRDPQQDSGNCGSERSVCVH